MNTRTLIVSLAATGVIGAAGYGLYGFGMSQGMKMAAPDPDGADAKAGKKILYWHDPMVPGQKFDKPGKSPFMDMQLVPMYEDGGGTGGVSVDPRMQQSLGVRTAEVTKGAGTPIREAGGSIA